MSGRERSEQAIAACHRAQQRATLALNQTAVLFSRRDREILSHVARGASLKQIADQMEIAERTAGAHVRNLCHKAGVEGREQLFIYTMQQPALRPGAECKRGIHLVDPACPCPHCRAILAA